MKTVNGGTTWTNVSIGTMEFLNSVYFLNENKGYVVDDGGNIFKTVNGGLTWSNDSSGTWTGLNSVFFTDSTTGYVVGNNGIILKIGDGGSVFIKEPKPSAIKFTICPNPANTKITILPAKASLEEIVVTIFTITGEQVMNKQFQNQNQLELDVSAMAKGIYLVKIQEKGWVEVQKLVID